MDCKFICLFFITPHSPPPPFNIQLMHGSGLRNFIDKKNVSFRRMAYGNESGLAIVDVVQKVCLFNVASPDLYGAQDPYSRTPRSPKRSEPYSREEQRSPSIDQVSDLCF